ncbi:MAG: hypothetical protein ACREE4_15000, partial [Stellaceae bacterium]
MNHPEKGCLASAHNLGSFASELCKSETFAIAWKRCEPPIPLSYHFGCRLAYEAINPNDLIASGLKPLVPTAYDLSTSDPKNCVNRSLKCAAVVSSNLKVQNRLIRRAGADLVCNSLDGGMSRSLLNLVERALPDWNVTRPWIFPQAEGVCRGAPSGR